jgi:uncharacterized membrane protein
MRIPSILRQDLSRVVHIGVAAGTGAAAGILVGAIAGWKFFIAAGWIATATIYLIWMWLSVARMSAAAIEVIVQQRHPAHRLADVIIVVASIASLGGVGHLFVAGSGKGPDATIAAIVGFSSVVASWLVLHAVYTVRYAILYYSEPVGGIAFDDDEKPTFADFAYVAFTVAISYGVTDTPWGSARSGSPCCSMRCCRICLAR